MRRAIRGLLRIILRVFFPRIEVSGAERVPGTGPVILVGNHPNGLIDPIFFLCLSERPVSFLAKAPLFDMPLIGWFVKGLDSIPAYRKQDGLYDAAKNRRTIERAREVLASGGVLGIFPEGASHDDPKLRPLKTGAARIALGVASEENADVVIAPIGIYYTAKGIFRSSALLYYGEPITVKAHATSDDEPHAEAVRELTQRIEAGLAQVTLQADEREALALVARAESVFIADPGSPQRKLSEKFEIRRRLIEGYKKLRAAQPERLESIAARIDRYTLEVQDAGLDPETLKPRQLPAVSRGFSSVIRVLLFLLIDLPLGIVGAIVNYPIYRLVGFLSYRLARGDEGMVATIKMIAGAVLYLLWWIVLAIVIAIYVRPAYGLAFLLLAPLAGSFALRFFENLARALASMKALTMQTFHRWGFLRLVAERRAISEEILKLAAEFEQ